MKRKYELDDIITELVEKGHGVKDLLTDMKDISSLMIDLAYSAVLFNNDDLARAVKDLEAEMNTLRYQVEVRAMLAAKTPMQATKLIGILRLASAAENIANAAERLADIVLRDIEIHPAIRESILESREAVDIIEIKKGSKLVGRTKGSLKKEWHGPRVLAIKKSGAWIVKPEEGLKLGANDLVIISGTRECINHVKKST